jgi:rubrerythrin
MILQKNLLQRGDRMDDLISRQVAIDAAEKESQVDGAYGYMDTKSIVDLLNNLPSAQPERKMGKWRHYEGYLTCSECGTEYDDDIMTHCYDDLPKFCPNCGAKMQKEGE